jgi:hypothetical protein
MQYIGVTEAAGILGISEHAVRQRAYRGSLPSKREGGRLLVSLDDQDTEISHKTSRETRRDETAETSETPDALVDLRAEVAFLRQQLVAREREVAELHVLLQRAQPALPATSSPQPPRDALGAAEVKSPVSSPSGPQGGAQRGWRGLWKRIVGG